MTIGAVGTFTGSVTNVVYAATSIDTEGGAGAQGVVGTVKYFGSASQPADNSTYTTSPAVITPPSSMQQGDLVVMIAQARSTTGTLSISQAGGQTWTSEAQQNGHVFQ